MTYQQIISLLQLIILNDPNTPVAGSQEFLQYSKLIGPAIADWQNEADIIWKELMVPQLNYATLAAGAPGTNTINLPSDFTSIYDGQVLITYPSGSQQVFKVKDQVDQLFNPYSQVREFYVYGNPSNGYTLVPGWTVAATDPEVGATVSFRYVKQAAQPTLDSSGNITDLNDIPEMSQPKYIVYNVAAQVQAANYNDNMAGRMEQKANYYLGKMRSANERPANYQDNYVRDADYLLRHQGTYRNTRIAPNGRYGA